MKENWKQQLATDSYGNLFRSISNYRLIFTVAIGLWISFPGRSPFNANGINAKAELNAVIKIGFKRSREPCITDSRNPIPSPRKCV